MDAVIDVDLEMYVIPIAAVWFFSALIVAGYVGDSIEKYKKSRLR